MTHGRTDLSDNGDPSLAMLLDMNIYNNYIAILLYCIEIAHEIYHTCRA